MGGLIQHVDLTVQELGRSAPFYEAVLAFMAYRRVRDAADGIDWDLLAPSGLSSIGIKPARTDRRHDRYTCGLHHVAWCADSRADVDRLHDLLRQIGATILDAPAEYPQYGDRYYAVFFADPDGLKFEFVHWPSGNQS